MTKKGSTTALTAEQHKAQDERYAQGHEYDYLIIGTGNSALTVGALLAHSGKRVCMLEAHDIPGGYAQNFKAGDYHFCAQVHYIWGCAPGGKIHSFLSKVGLDDDITFELFDKKGYDRMAMPDGKSVMVPYGFGKLIDNIEEAYPGNREAMAKFVKIMEKMRQEMGVMPSNKISFFDLITKIWKVRTVFKYRKSTLQDIFDECELSKEAQAVLCANAGDFMLPPEKLSFIMYVALFGGYNTGAYYPTKHFKYYIDRVAEFIEEHEGCHIYYETEVSKINMGSSGVKSVETKNGKTFEAANYICNMDPKKASKIIGQEKFPKSYLRKLDYDYSPAGVVVYLGLKDIDLREHGFGSFNTWHLEQWDMNEMWKEMADGDFTKPWIFMSTPTLHTDQPGTAPEGNQILEIAAYVEYKPFKQELEKNYMEYNKFKMKIANRMIDLVEEKYIPDLRKHIDKQVVGSPMTNEDFVLAPYGNAYGANMTPENIKLGKLRATTPWKNLHWCNATSGGAGFYGTTMTGMNLYMDLTGDRFFDEAKSKSDQEFIDAL